MFHKNDNLVQATANVLFKLPKVIPVPDFSEYDNNPQIKDDNSAFNTVSNILVKNKFKIYILDLYPKLKAGQIHDIDCFWDFIAFMETAMVNPGIAKSGGDISNIYVGISLFQPCYWQANKKLEASIEIRLQKTFKEIAIALNIDPASIGIEMTYKEKLSII